MNSFEQEALRRAQEMQGRVSTPPNRPQSTSESSSHHHNTSRKEAPHSEATPKQNERQSDLVKNTAPDSLRLNTGLDSLFEDKEKLLILLLILILSSEESSDSTLILALLYVII